MLNQLDYKKALDVLHSFPRDALVSEFYDDLPEFSDALGKIFGDAFEYPDFSGKTIAQVVKMAAKEIAALGMSSGVGDPSLSADEDPAYWAQINGLKTMTAAISAGFADAQKPKTKFAAGEWSHLFGVGSKETRCRIVIDLEQSRLVAAQEWTGLKFESVNGDRLKNLAESVIEVNEAHANFDDWATEMTNELPAWADQRKLTNSRFDTEQEAYGYKLKNQLDNRVVEPIGGGKWGLVFPIESHVQVNDSVPAGKRQHERKVQGNVERAVAVNKLTEAVQAHQTAQIERNTMLLGRNQAAMAERAFEAYNFGEGVAVAGVSGWEYYAAGHERSREVYVENVNNDGKENPSTRLGFTVRYDPQTGALVEAYAEDAKGSAFGCMPEGQLEKLNAGKVPMLAPSFEVGQRFGFKPGEAIVGNGYRGTVIKVLDGQLAGMVEARLPGGVGCLSSSFPECFPAFNNGVEVVTEGRFFGSVKEVAGQFIVQDAGRGKLVAHECHRFEDLPAVGDVIDLQHHAGKVTFVAEKDKGRGNER